MRPRRGTRIADGPDTALTDPRSSTGDHRGPTRPARALNLPNATAPAPFGEPGGAPAALPRPRRPACALARSSQLGCGLVAERRPGIGCATGLLNGFPRLALNRDATDVEDGGAPQISSAWTTGAHYENRCSQAQAPHVYGVCRCSSLRRAKAIRDPNPCRRRERAASTLGLAGCRSAPTCRGAILGRSDPLEAGHDGDVDWEVLSAALLDLVGHHVTIDVIAAGTPVPIAGLQGILLNVTEGHPEGRPNDQWSMGLRVHSDGSQDTSYLHVVRTAFRGRMRQRCLSMRPIRTFRLTGSVLLAGVAWAASTQRRTLRAANCSSSRPDHSRPPRLGGREKRSDGSVPNDLP